MMFFIEKPSFTIQMHPGHTLLGLLMVVAAIVHLSLNFQGLKNHLRNRRAAAFGIVLVIALVVLYGVTLNNRLPADLAQQMDDAAARAEQRE
jgi:cytochrome bd-type quinol oxidase subunit 1